MYDIFEKLLAEKGITAYRVAKETGISTATLTAWKKGEYVPKGDKLFKIAEYLGVTVHYLTTGKNEEKPEIPVFEPEHLELIDLYSKLNKEQKSAVLNMMRSFALND